MWAYLPPSTESSRSSLSPDSTLQRWYRSISSVKYDVFRATFKKRCLSNSWAVGRCKEIGVCTICSITLTCTDGQDAFNVVIEYNNYTLLHGGVMIALWLQLTCSGSLFRQVDTNSWRGREKSSSNWGGLFLGIRNNTRMGCRSALGGFPSASSIAVIPRDQISACRKWVVYIRYIEWQDKHAIIRIKALHSWR